MKRTVFVALVAGAVAVAAGGGPALAEEGDPAPASEREGRGARVDAAEALRDGTFNPQTASARIGAHHVAAMIYGGYDTTDSAQGGNVNGFVEGALARQVAVRVGVSSLLGAGTSQSRNVYSVGLRVGVLRQETSGVDVALGATYKSTGMTESTGEIEMSILVGRRFDRLALYGNLQYGQGFVTSERDGEVRLGALYAVTDRLQVGLDGFGRFDLGDGGSSRPRRAGEADFELLAGPLATVSLGPVALLAQAGFHAVVIDQTNVTGAGLAAIAGVGSAF